jgi:hypothetical protein
MRSGGSVQFKGIPNALRAYENMGIPCWSLWCGKSLLLSYKGTDIEEGKAVLSDYLNMCDQDSVATYSLCCYDGIGKTEKITSSTPYHASFNFKLTEGDYPSRSMQKYGTMHDEQSKSIAEMKLQLEEMRKQLNEKDDEEDEGGMGSIAGVLNGLLEQPEIKAAIAGKIVGLLNNIIPMGNTQNQIGKVAGFDATDQRVDSINRSLQVLASVDPKLDEHLERLAEIAVKQPKTFDTLISMLNTF